MKIAIFAAFLLIAAACAPAPTQPKYEIEVITIEEQAAQAVNESATDFVVPESEQSITWERSKLFFSTYTSGMEEQEFDYPRPGVSMVTHPRDKDKYIYEIEYSQAKNNDGYRYVVSCSRNSRKGGSDYSAHRNAKNVARFVREGNLELSLLDR